MNLRHTIFVLGLALVATLLLGAATAQKTSVAYNSIPKPLPGNVASVGPEAYAFIELGDGLGTYGNIAPLTSTIGDVTVVLSSWACQSGSWQANCVSGKNASFNQDITFNLYAVSGNFQTGGPYVVGAQLGSITQTFSIPYRPSATPNKCANAGQWYSNKEKTCYNGIAVPVTMDFSSLDISMPANGAVVVTVAYNTTDYGPNPMGQQACNTADGGCPYDSLNISTDTTNGSFPANPGYSIDPNGVFVSPSLNYAQCPGTLALIPGSVQEDTGCWGGYHPQVMLTVNLK